MQNIELAFETFVLERLAIGRIAFEAALFVDEKPILILKYSQGSPLLSCPKSEIEETLLRHYASTLTFVSDPYVPAVQYRPILETVRYVPHQPPQIFIRLVASLYHFYINTCDLESFCDLVSRYPNSDAHTAINTPTNP